MPSDDRCRFDDHEGVAPIGPDPGEQNPEQAIPLTQPRLWSLAFECGELLTESQFLQMCRRNVGINGSEKGQEEQTEHHAHGQEAILPMARKPRILRHIGF